MSRLKPRQDCDPDIVDALKDLHQQATVERSHFYAGQVIGLARIEIEQLRWKLAEAERLLKQYDDGFRPHAEIASAPNAGRLWKRRT